MNLNLLEKNNFFFTQEFSTLEIKGKDAQIFLQNLISNDILLLKKQTFLHSIIPNTSGKIAFEVFLTKIKNSFTIFILPEEKEALQKHLEFYHILEELEILEKPKKSFYYLLFCDLSTKKNYKIHSNNILLKGERYFLTNQLPEKMTKLKELNKVAFENTRAFFALPKNKVDYNEKRLPQEAALHKIISFKKGCFIGQEAIARLEYKGKLVRILSQVSAEIPMEKEQKITDGNQILGNITSSSPYPYKRRYYGLAYLKTSSLLKNTDFFLEKSKETLQVFPLEYIYKKNERRTMET